MEASLFHARGLIVLSSLDHINIPMGYLISTFGTAGLFIWLIVYLFVLHQDKGERVVGWLASILAWTGRTAEKTATASNIQWQVDSFMLGLNREVSGLLPLGLKIKWISPGISKEAFIQDERVVVMLDYHGNRDDNLARATMFYMNKAVIPEARSHIDHKLSDAIDLMMTKKALYSFVEARSSMNHFVATVLRPKTESDIDLKAICGVIDSMDERGLFTRVLLKELMELGIRRAGVTETGDTVIETNQFVRLLNNIANKERGVNVDCDFIRADIRMSVVMVARPEKIALGPDTYLMSIERLLKQSARTLYVFARGERNIQFAKEVVQGALSRFSELANGHEEEFPTKIQDGTIFPTYCAILYNRKAL